MYILQQLYGTLRHHVRRVSWMAVCVVLVAHMLITWLLLVLAGEHELSALHAFPYYFMTTATTIGYGDLSPSSTAGRYIVAFWMMPVAVGLFGTVLAKTSASLTAYWKRHQLGKMTYNDMSGHTIVVGWRPGESERLVQLLLLDATTDDEGIVIVAEGLAEHPYPDGARYVATGSYADASAYQRAGISSAARVIVNPGSDDQAIAAIFAVMANSPSAHVVVRFDSPAPAQLVQAHYPQVECTRPMIAEIIARAANDPGSAAVTSELLSIDSGPTQFSLQLPPSMPAVPYGRIVELLKASAATVLGFRGPGERAPVVNPDTACVVQPESTLYYLADRRIDCAALDWSAVSR